MPNNFLIDGYNLLHALGILTGKVSPGGLERARVRLQDFLAAAFGEEAACVTVVYDAAHAPRRVQSEQTYKGLHILFAVGMDEADDLIETLIAKNPSPEKLTVVSSDHRLQKAGRRRHAAAQTCSEFLDFLEKRGHQHANTPADTSAKTERLSPAEIQHWLQEFAGMQDEPDLKAAFEKYDFEDE